MDAKSISGLAKQLNTLFSSHCSDKNEAIMRLMRPIKMDPVAMEFVDSSQSQSMQEISCLPPSLLEVQKETLFCVTCPYSSDALDKMKCHTFSQHPKSAAVITNNSRQAVSNLPSAVFFCIKEACTLFTVKYDTYEEHLMNCCSLEQNFSEDEKERLKASLQFVFDLEKLHYLTTFSRFLDFFSAFKEMYVDSGSSDVVDEFYDSAEEKLNLHESNDRMEPEDCCIMRNTPSSFNRLSSHSSTSMSCNVSGEVFQVVVNSEGCEDDHNSDTMAQRRSYALFKSESSPEKTIPCQEPKKLTIGQESKDSGSNRNTQEDIEMFCEDLSDEFYNSSLEEMQGSRITEENSSTVTVNLDDVHACILCQLTFSSRHLFEFHMKKQHKEHYMNHENKSHLADLIVQTNGTVRDGLAPMKKLQNDNHEYIPCKQMFSSLQLPECHMLGDHSEQHGNESNEDEHSDADRNGQGYVHNICPDINQNEDSGQYLVTETDPMEFYGTLKSTQLRTFKCTKCDKDLNYFIGLNNQMCVETHEYSSDCKKCTVVLKPCDSLHQHTSGQLRDRRLKCRTDEIFSTHYNEESQRFKCQLCGNICVNNQSLKRHMRKHTGENLAKCLECGKHFVDNGNLRRHMRTHTGEKPFKCDDCGKSFNDNGNFLKHKRKNDGENVFKCNRCDQTFIQKCQLKCHMRLHAASNTDLGPLPPGPTFSCQECGKDFTKRACFIQHTRRHTNTKNELCKCFVCGKNLVDNSNLRRHMRTHTGEKPFQCLECGKKFLYNTSLSRHMRTHTGEKPFKCLECGKNFSDKGNLNKHKGITGGGKILRCNKCDQTFTERCKLQLHMQLHAETGTNAYLRTHLLGKPFSCKECSKEFTNRYYFNKHVKRHSNSIRKNEPFNCFECNKSFSSKAYFNLHMKTHIQCKECGKIVVSNRSLVRHMRLHTGERPYVCDKCGKAFALEAHLLSHAHTHRGEKPFRCDQCPMKFNKNHNLLVHMRRHSGEKPFLCTACGKRFIQYYLLHAHMRIHVGEKPYKCNECGKRFRIKQYHDLHVRAHTGEKPHACRMCGRKFNFYSNLRRHRMRAHFKSKYKDITAMKTS